MTIFFDARMIEHPGIGRYIRCLLTEFKKQKEINLHLLGNKILIGKYLGINENIIDFDYPIYSTQEQLGFLHLKKIIGSNILHIPHYNIPVLTNFKLVATIHDLIHIVYPQGASKKFASVYMKLMVERVLKKAKKIICVSNSTKNSLEKIYGEKNLNVNVIYEGVEENFSQINDTTYLFRVKEKYKLPQKFILYVGSLRRHKNIKMLLESFSKLRERLPDASLVVVGRLSHHFDFNKKNVLYIGEVPDDKELAAIYNLSCAFCNLSLYEGFGLTVLEAQQCGTPVVCSDIAPHLEIGGNGVCAVSVQAIDHIVDALYNVLIDDNLRNTLIQKGFENIYRFNWADTANKTTAIYKELLMD
ncbi:MAG: glycosyltransferase family 1 protein [Candidatus Omnitrophica bacterium]|nr:glycosyltransferase family 1 protein [Candidatus Omnitrophota bacterium]